MVFAELLDPVLSPLLNMPTLWAVIILSFVISLIITLVYKYTTDQNLMKELKSEMKEFQKQIKELKKEPEKAMKVQKQAMQTNMKYMMHSMRSTLYSIIPIILIFGWMNANFAYLPITPNEEFTTSVFFEEGVEGSVEISVPEGIEVEGNDKKEIKGEVKWVLSGKKGEYLLEYLVDGNKYSKELLISDNRYKEPIKSVGDGRVDRIELEHEKNVVIDLGFWEMGWLATYIVFAIAFSILVRKIVRVY